MDASLLAVVGRVLIGALFVAIGARLLLARIAVAGVLAAKKIPSPAFVALAGGVIEIALGVLAILGVAMPVVALAMAVFVVAATLMVHDFWRLSGPARAQEVNTVLMHSLVVGGLLIMAAYPW